MKNVDTFRQMATGLVSYYDIGSDLTQFAKKVIKKNYLGLIPEVIIMNQYLQNFFNHIIFQ